MVVEFVLSLTVWVALFVGLVSVGRILIAQHRAHRLARYGTLLQSSGRLSEAVVRQELENYAAALSSGDGAATWQIEIGRFLGTPSASFYRLMQTRVKWFVRGQARPVVESVVAQQEAPAA